MAQATFSEENMDVEEQVQQIPPVTQEEKDSPFDNPLFSMTEEEVAQAYEAGSIDDTSLQDYITVKDMRENPIGTFGMPIDYVQYMANRNLIAPAQFKEYLDFHDDLLNFSYSEAAYQQAVMHLSSGKSVEDVEKIINPEVEANPLIDPTGLIAAPGNAAVTTANAVYRLGAKGVQVAGKKIVSTMARNVAIEMGFDLAATGAMVGVDHATGNGIYTALSGIAGPMVASLIVTGAKKGSLQLLRAFVKRNPEKAKEVVKAVEEVRVQNTGKPSTQEADPEESYWDDIYEELKAVGTDHYAVSEMAKDGVEQAGKGSGRVGTQGVDALPKKPVKPKYEGDERIHDSLDTLVAVKQAGADIDIEFSQKFMQNIAENTGDGGDMLKVFNVLIEKEVNKARFLGGELPPMKELARRARSAVTRLHTLVGDDPDKAADFLIKRTGDNAAAMRKLEVEAMAQNQLMEDYTKYVQTLADTAMESGQMADKIRWLEHMEKLAEVSENVQGVAASFGRGLNVFKKQMGSLGWFDPKKMNTKEIQSFEMDRGHMIDEMLAAFRRHGKGGPKDSIRSARSMARGGKMQRFLIGVLEWEQSALVSSPDTQIANILGSVYTLSTESVVRSAGFAFQRFVKGDALGGKEARAYFTGMWEGLMRGLYIPNFKQNVKDLGVVGAFRKNLEQSQNGRVWNALWTGEPQLDKMVKMEGQSSGIIPDFKIKGFNLPLGTIMRLPFHGLTAMDDFFKSIAYHGELGASAWEQMSKEGVPEKQWGTAFKRLTDPITGSPELHHKALTKSRVITLTNDLGDTAKYVDSALKTNLGLVAKIATIPFFRIAVNLTKYAAKQTPLGALSKEQSAIIMKGTARQRAELATRYALGGMLLSLGYYGWKSGSFFGRIDPTERDARRNANLPAYSIRGDSIATSITKLDPPSFVIGLGADFGRALDTWQLYAQDIRAEEGEEPIEPVELEDALMATLAMLADPIREKTVLQGIRDGIQLIAEPERMDLERFFATKVDAMIPYSKGIDWAHRLFDSDDEQLREINDMQDVVWAKLAPHINPKYRDIWGKPIERADRVLGMNQQKRNDTAITEELLRLKVNVSNKWGKKIPMPVMGMPDHEMSDDERQELNDYLLASPLKEEVTAFMASEDYANCGADSVRKQIVQRMFNQARQAAVGQFWENHPELVEKVELIGEKLTEAVDGKRQEPNVNRRLYNFGKEE